MRKSLIVIVCVLALPVGALGMFSAAIWLSDRLHEFGPWDPRYVLLVQGTDVARLDLLEPISGSIRYSAQGQDGNAPARVFVEFTTAFTPARAMEAYEARCSAIGLQAHHVMQDDRSSVLRCDGPDSELGIHATRLEQGTLVTLGGLVAQGTH